MKKQTISTTRRTVKAFILRFGFASLLLGNLLSVRAQEKTKPVDPPLYIKHLGSLQNDPVFQVDFANENTGTYILSIKEDDGSVLYSEKVKAKQYTKKFRWISPDANDSKLIFSLYNEQTKQTTSFEMNTSLRTIQDVVVTRL